MPPLKGNLTVDYEVFKLTVGKRVFSGLRQIGELGAVRRLQQADGQEIYLYDMRSKLQLGFDHMFRVGADHTVIAASPGLLDQMLNNDGGTASDQEPAR